METDIRIVLVITALFAGTLPVAAQQRRANGPVDGAELAPLDTGRVSIGTRAPDFTLETKEGGSFSLSQLRTRKNVVLVFYRGHW